MKTYRFVFNKISSKYYLVIRYRIIHYPVQDIRCNTNYGEFLHSYVSVIHILLHLSLFGSAAHGKLHEDLQAANRQPR